MATESSRGLSDHLRGVTVTTLACLAGVGATITSTTVVGLEATAATSELSLVIVAAFVLVQYPVLYAIGVDVSEFGVKDNLYVSFMTFALWYLTYAVLLSTEVAA
ncbi:hypothetical protein [Halolamina sp.]|jgi:uncharacterized membrane protein|uniref:EMC6-like membrane protein n=1 Tax=Halolamina sp. TaxID=1940283 RepID=UPI000223BB94|nr:hypothetical protein Halar_3693 [halophilic archaeon DL31]